MSENKRGIDILNKTVLIIIAVVVSSYSYVYDRIIKTIKKPIKRKVKKVLLLLVDTIDDENSGIIVFFSLLIEIILLLIIPWFFSWVFGLIIISYLFISLLFFFILLEADKETKSWEVTLFIILLIPYLFLALLPTIVLTIIRDKPEDKLSIMELRRTKLKRLKKQIRYNKLKFWKKWF